MEASRNAVVLHAPAAGSWVAFADVDGTRQWIAANRRALTIPANPQALQTLAARYRHPVLGSITVVNDGQRPYSDFGAWRAPLASRRNADGSTTFVAATAGWSPGLLAGQRDGKRTLTIRDQQHEYVHVESGTAAETESRR